MIESVTQLDEVIDRRHKKCAWCRARFIFTNPTFQRYKGLDGHYYCSPEHASAMYMERFDAKLRAMG
jgi:hypothetical protein